MREDVLIAFCLAVQMIPNYPSTNPTNKPGPNQSKNQRYACVINSKTSSKEADSIVPALNPKTKRIISNADQRLFPRACTCSVSHPYAKLIQKR